MAAPNGMNKTNYEQVLEFVHEAQKKADNIDTILKGVQEKVDQIDTEDSSLYFGTKSAMAIKEEFERLAEEFYKFKAQIDKYAKDAETEAETIKNAL